MDASPALFATPEDLLNAVGTRLPTTEWMVVEQERIDTFADAIGDHQWIHVDAERAAGGPFGSTIAHGYLTLSLIGGLIADVISVPGASSVLNYGLEKVRFPAPVPVGSWVRLTSSIAAAEPAPGGVQLSIQAQVECRETTKPACVATAVYRFLN
jgi:acyl dehydratase